MDGHRKSDFLSYYGEESLRGTYPEITTDRQIEEIREKGTATILLNIVTGDTIRVTRA